MTSVSVWCIVKQHEDSNVIGQHVHLKVAHPNPFLSLCSFSSDPFTFPFSLYVIYYLPSSFPIL